MLKLEPPDIQRPELIEINLPVFAFAAAVSILTTLVFGLAPAIAASRSDLNSALKAGGAWGASAARVRSRQFLIAVEVAMALVLVTGAGLMIRSFHEIVSTGVGFETAHLTAADIDLPEKRYPDGASQSRFFRNLMDRARSAPGVALVGVADNLPLHSVSCQNFWIVGRPEPPIGSLPIADFANASPQYFNTLGLRLEGGRFFTDGGCCRHRESRVRPAFLPGRKSRRKAALERGQETFLGDYRCRVGLPSAWARRMEPGPRSSGLI
jgi:putative ABC transport system permease protein